jgi:hypothetical protein
MKRSLLVPNAAAVAAAMVLLGSAAPARAQSLYGFDCITNSAGPSCADGESTLRMSVAPGSTANSVDFTFTNFSDLGSSVTEIYFDDGTLLGLASVTDSGAGVQFSQIGSGNPSNLPGGNSVTPGFQTTAGFLIDVGSGGNTRGVEDRLDGGVQEFVRINFTLQPGRSYADTLTALNGPLGDGLDLRVGLHVRGFALPYGSGISESFINLASPIPESDALVLFGAGLFALVRLRRR